MSEAMRRLEAVLVKLEASYYQVDRYSHKALENLVTVFAAVVEEGEGQARRVQALEQRVVELERQLAKFEKP